MLLQSWCVCVCVFFVTSSLVQINFKVTVIWVYVLCVCLFWDFECIGIEGGITSKILNFVHLLIHPYGNGTYSNYAFFSFYLHRSGLCVRIMYRPIVNRSYFVMANVSKRIRINQKSVNLIVMDWPIADVYPMNTERGTYKKRSPEPIATYMSFVFGRRNVFMRTCDRDENMCAI